MKVTVNGHQSYAFTGSRELDQRKQTVMFVHGASLDHTVWTLPARHFARHGWNVLAADLPGHGMSDGNPLPEISQYANWLCDLLDAVGVEQTALVGHSMGSLVALDCAARHLERIRALTLIGTAVPMPVTDQLLQSALENNHDAIDMLTAWGHSPAAHFGGHEVPGMWMIGGTMRLFERARPGTLYNDLNACNNYTTGIEMAQRVTCPTMFILGEHDMLTPKRSALELAKNISDTEIVVLPKTGHTIMSERPDALLDALARIV
ncbi:MAG: alpha/beta hydrolase [Acidiferrobacterales bacterium]|nr:alpha/beta hydrolase [Acidiferrobacterales bacterium]